MSGLAPSFLTAAFFSPAALPCSSRIGFSQVGGMTDIWRERGGCTLSMLPATTSRLLATEVLIDAQPTWWRWSGTGAVLIEKGWPHPGGDPSGNGEETKCAGTGTTLRSQLSGRLFLCRTRGV